MSTSRTIASYSPAQTRVIEAALELFSEHGINGTSLQMIADAVGVTKAAVYHQFNAKDDIVLAAAGLIIDRLAELAVSADAASSRSRLRGELIDGLIELAVERRRAASVLQQDPVMLRLFREHEPFRRVLERLDNLLMGDHSGPQARVTVAMLITAIGGTVMHPLVSDIDDDTLRAQLRRLARSLFKFLQ